MKEIMSMLKSSLAKKDSELNFFGAALHSQKEAYFRLERKNANISHSYDKFLAKFDAYHKSVEHPSLRLLSMCTSWAT